MSAFTLQRLYIRDPSGIKPLLFLNKTYPKRFLSQEQKQAFLQIFCSHPHQCRQTQLRWLLQPNDEPRRNRGYHKKWRRSHGYGICRNDQRYPLNRSRTTSFDHRRGLLLQTRPQDYSDKRGLPHPGSVHQRVQEPPIFIHEQLASSPPKAQATRFMGIQILQKIH